MIDRMFTLDQAQLNKIHDVSMKILATIGVLFDDAEVVGIFKRHGFKVDGNVVFFRESQVTKAIESAPSDFNLAARDPAKSVHIGGEDFVLAPGYGAPYVLTTEAYQQPATLIDYHNFCKLVHTSTVLNMNGFMMVQPTDITPATAHLDMMYANIVLCDRPFMGSPVSRQGALDGIEMAALVWGDKNTLKETPVMASLITPFSPLRYTAEMAASVHVNAMYGQACVFGTLIIGGASGPLTIAGLLIQQNAEVMAGITLAQLVRPGLPVLYGGGSSVADLRSGGLSMGSPEFCSMTAATAAVARYYNLPARAGSGVTDAHLPGAQAGIEAALAIYTGIRDGAHFILHAAGMLGTYIAMSYEKFIIDEEICRYVLKMIAPFDVNDDAINLDTMSEINIGGDYLSHPDTFRNCRTAFYQSQLMNRDYYQSWNDMGRQRIEQKASTIVKQRLAEYEQPDIDPAIDRELRKYIAKRQG